MKIAIISNNYFLKETLEQVFSLEKITINLINNSEINSNFDIYIYDEVTPLEAKSNNITISSHDNADLVKPYKLDHLITLLIENINQKTYYIKEIKYTPNQRILEYKNNLVSLTEKENNLVSYLIIHNKRKISKAELLRKIWNYSEDIETTTLEVHLSRLKQKLIENNFPDFLCYKERYLHMDI